MLAGAGAVGLRAPELSDWSETDVFAFGALVAAIVLAEQFQIPFRRRSETHNLALTDSVWTAALVLVRPSVLTFALAAGVTIGQAFRRWAPYKIAFNVGQFLIAITAAQVIYHEAFNPGKADQLSAWTAAAVAMAAFFVLNTSAVALVIALVEHSRLINILKRPLGLRLILWCGNLTLGILAAFLVSEEPAALPLLAVPAVMSYIAYREWSRSMRAVEAALARERRFISDASHELRTPITICRGHLEVLDPEDDPDDLRNTMRVVVDELGLMARIVDDMMIIAHAEQPAFVHPEHVDLDELVEDVASKARPLLNGRLRVSAVPTHAVVRADRQRLTQALINLLHNAAVHTRASLVDLRVSEEEAGYRFAVSDNGGGLPPGDEEVVFQPFHRADVSRPGTGLGLPIVRAIAEAHGGSAGVDNQAGEGATFWIRLPT